MYKDIKFIAEIGSNHNNNLSRIEKLIKQSAELGFWGVKFQLFKADKMYLNKEDQKNARRMELNPNLLPEIRRLCDKYEIEFGCTPFYTKGVDLLEKHEVDFYKISSFDIKRMDLIKKAAQTKKKVIISLGLADGDDYRDIIELYLKDRSTSPIGKDKLVFLHCVSGYPVAPEHAGMSRIDELRIHFCELADLGYSDHTRNLSVIFTAINKGVNYIEMHVDLDDGEGAEYKHGHCWTMNDVGVLKQMLEEMEASESKFIKMNSELLADAKTGLRG
jgi:N-acetylneuraminate synthase